MPARKVVFGGASVAGTANSDLPPGSDALRFQFAALTYGNPPKPTINICSKARTRIGRPGASRREANYSGLGPGHYRFRVRSRTGDGRTGEEGDYAFTILPPWYRTTLAYVVYGLLFCCWPSPAGVLISRYEREKAQRRDRGS